MLQIRQAGYTVHDLMELKLILSTGLGNVTKDCAGNCDRCEHSKVCTDINNAYFYLDEVIANAESERSQKVHK